MPSARRRRSAFRSSARARSSCPRRRRTGPRRPTPRCRPADCRARSAGRTGHRGTRTGCPPRYGRSRVLLPRLQGALWLRGATARAELGLHCGQLVLDRRAGRELSELAVDVVLAVAERGDVVERAGLLELLDGARARAHVLDLVLGALHREPEVGHLLADAVGGLGDPHLGLGGGVLRLDDLLLGAEGLDLGAQLLLVRDQLLLLVLELGDLRVERVHLGLRDVLALERHPRQILATLRERLARLRVELDDALLELVLLHLKALLGRDHVRDALLHVLKQLYLLLVAVVERLGGVLRAVEK